MLDCLHRLCLRLSFRRQVTPDEMDEETVHGLLQRMAAQKRDRKITLHGDEETISATGEIVIRWGQRGKEFTLEKIRGNGQMERGQVERKKFCGISQGSNGEMGKWRKGEMQMQMGGNRYPRK